MKQQLSVISMSLIWLSLPFCLFMPTPVKFSTFIFILTSSMLFSHSGQAYIYYPLLKSNNKGSNKDSNKVLGILLIILYGPIEIRRLQKAQTMQASM